MELVLRMPLDRVYPFPFLKLMTYKKKKTTNPYDNCQKDLERFYELQTPSLFKSFHLLKATVTVERILGVTAKQALVHILTLPFTSCMVRKKSLTFSESFKLLFLEAVGLNKRSVLGLAQRFFAK